MAYDYEEEEYVILTASPVNDSGLPSKEKPLLVPGDEVITLMMVMSEGLFVDIHARVLESL